MTPNKQVSPVIRISQGERDASARATHLEAAFEKYSKTTIERKQMSTTTNFKRIALVAVASLGLGVLSSVPSNAAINADSVTLSATTAAQTTAETYTATSATVTVSFFGAQNDSMSVTTALTSAPAGNTALPVLRLVETSSATVETTNVGRSAIVGDTFTANTAVSVRAQAGTVVTTAKFAVYLALSTNTNSAPSVVGSYGVKITPATLGGSGALQGSVAQNLTITVTAATSLDTKVAAATSDVFLQLAATTAGDTWVPLADSTVATPKTAATSTAASVAFLYIMPMNAADTNAARESLTVTTTLGGLGTATGAILGRSLIVKGVGGEATRVYIYPDGNAGKASVTVTTASGVLLSTKSVTFAGTATKFGTAAIPATSASVIGLSGTTTTIVGAAAQDVDGNVASDATVYAFSSDSTKATVPATAITYAAATSNFPVTVTAVAVGTVTITFGNASTLAASTFKSNAVTVRVGNIPSAAGKNVKVALDKATYAPGEQAKITVTVVDADGNAVVGGSAADVFAAGGISANATLGTASDTTTATTFDIAALTNTKVYTVYMPFSAGTGKVKFSWTGGTGLAAANQVAGSVEVNLTDTNAANAAAIAALQTSVASLRTLLVTLTNLVLKIQKKVKA
jgi:trimeric autotransporter adhesin